MPKKTKPTKPTDYSLVALCNVIMKIITKTIANSLKPILPTLISENQSAFVHQRLITDNIMVYFKVFHHINKNYKRTKEMVGIKLDMEKAYDRLDWNFINKTLTSIGMLNKITKLVMNCVTTVRLSILINVYPIEYLKPARGIRQRYPLSPYLFILYVDVFSNLINSSIKTNNFRGIYIARRPP